MAGYWRARRSVCPHSDYPTESCFYLRCKNITSPQRERAASTIIVPWQCDDKRPVRLSPDLSACRLRPLSPSGTPTPA